MLSGGKKAEEKFKKKKKRTQAKEKACGRPWGTWCRFPPSPAGTSRGLRSQERLTGTSARVTFLGFTTPVCRKCYIKGEKETTSNVLRLFRRIWFRNWRHGVRTEGAPLCVSFGRWISRRGPWRGSRGLSLCHSSCLQTNHLLIWTTDWQKRDFYVSFGLLKGNNIW